jgi:hypothetical protein
MDSLYFPTGLVVSQGGNVLYAANSDFDLQWNGGTLQAYDLYRIRQDTARLIQANLASAACPQDGTAAATKCQTSPDPTNTGIPFLSPWVPNCINAPPQSQGNLFGVQLSQGCSPPVDSTQYVTDSAIIGAFATDLQTLPLQNGKTRLLMPVAGSATITWADTVADNPNVAPPAQGQGSYAPFGFDCGLRDSQGRCAGDHQTGNDPNSPGNTRNETMPGEPFGMALSQDLSALVVTSESDTETSLLTTGLPPFAGLAGQGYPTDTPTMQYVLPNMPNGGVAVASVPHDSNSVVRCEETNDAPSCIYQAFLQTSRYSAEVDLLRFYPDNGAAYPNGPPTGSSEYRPFLNKERAYTIDANSYGSDFRGIAIDPTPRLRCELENLDTPQNCGQIPARVFIASRTPPTLVVGEIGLGNTLTGGYDPDAFVVTGNIPLPAGPSKVYLAPVVLPDYPGAPTAHYELRVFVVLFDSSGIAIINPDSPPPQIEREFVSTGPGPYAIAFDPFDWNDVATHAAVPADPRQPPDLDLPRYRFAYVASFTQSYAQVVDLDAQATNYQTYEQVVFNLGGPSYPKGQTP